MTAALTVIDVGGSNQLTVYDEKIEYVLTKTLIKINPPTSTANWTNGPKDTKVIDLLRIDELYNVTGHINSADESKLKGAAKAGGVLNVTIKGASYTANFEKLTIANDGRENDELPVMFTLVIGVN